MKRQVRQSKYDPLVDEVELIDANPEYAHVRLSDGRETTVSLRHLAPPGDVPPGNVMGDALPVEQQQAGFENGEVTPSNSPTAEKQTLAEETSATEPLSSVRQSPLR